MAPLNLIGDYAGGSLFMGMLMALNERNSSGKGQVIDAAITDGGTHFYDGYDTADNKFISQGFNEPQFQKILINKAKLDPTQYEPQMDKNKWPECRN